MSIANTNAETIIAAGIIEENDQVAARVEHLKELETLVGNSYPNKYERTKISGAEDTISNLLKYEPVAEIAEEFEAHKAQLNEGEKPDQELKAQLNEKLKAFGSVRVSGRLAVPPRVMGKAAFVHLSDGISRLQIYVRRDDAKGVYNGKSEPSASAGGLSATTESSADISNADAPPPADADGSDAVSGWELFKLLDHGDFVGAEGYLFLTNTGELSVHVETFQFLSKALMPMPDKMHDIGDAEISRRYRYVDLIASSLRNKTDEELEEEKRTGEKKLTTREVFERRAKLISGMRRFLDDAGYIEVETPMLTPKATGAAATPFATHHNALDIPLYARIAPELYLKRLTVGGFEKVYELNRNFRNEGLSHKHNPEFTMLEFYCAYMDVNGMMDFCEEMIQESVKKATGGSLQVKYGENVIDFSKFERRTMHNATKDDFSKLLSSAYSEFKKDAVDNKKDDVANALSSKYPHFGDENYVRNLLDDPREVFNFATAFQEAHRSGLFSKGIVSRDDFIKMIWTGLPYEMARNRSNVSDEDLNESETAKRILYLFENFVEEDLGITEAEKLEEVEIEEIKEIGRKTVQPTFIIDYPKSISPLSKASPENPQIAERFELFINGMECANGFSELNDPQEQYERFVDQMKERESGDAEAMVLDEDYIRALAYGMPPAAGIGIGIDRLVMLLTNKHSIRDVILFPHMRPENKQNELNKEEE